MSERLKMPRKKSVVWDHFDETEKGKKAKCSYCSQLISISGGSLSNLARHIRKKHPTLLFFTQSQDTFDFGQYSHEFITEIIEIYKNNPCLWNTESKDYINYKLKGKAYETLVVKFQENDPKANKDTVIRTFNYIRKSYRKELKKIKEFSQTAVENDVYTSELWYFELLNFLQDIDMPHDNAPNSVSMEEESMNMQDTNMVSMMSDAEDCNPGSSFMNRKRPMMQKRKHEYENVHELLEECMSAHFSDRFDYLAKWWTMTIRSVERDQQIYAEKLICEVLCEAQLGSLSRDSALCTRVNPLAECNQDM